MRSIQSLHLTSFTTIERCLIASFVLSSLFPLTPVVSQPSSTPTGTIATPTKYPTYPDQYKPDFEFVKIPLKQACDILRLFYNSTGGPEWTIKDGWEKGTAIHNNPEITLPHSQLTPLSNNDWSFKRADPALPRLPAPTRTGPPPATTLDPSNCCGWHGVICVGPDGNMPPSWPPYDDDYDPSTSIKHTKRRRGLMAQSSRGKDEDSVVHPRYYPQGQQYDKQRSHRMDVSSGHLSTAGTSLPPSVQPSPPNRQPTRETDDDWHIIGPVPECLGSLPNLMVLDLSNNELSEPVPQSIANLTHLRRLDLSSNLLQGPFPEPITRIVMMQELILKNNYMTGALPNSILKMKQLTQFSIANNELDGPLPVGMFGALKKLRVFNINGNGFTGEIGSDVGELEGLIKFDVRANELKGTIPDSIGRCKKLEMLDLGDNHFTGELPNGLFNLTNLKILDLTANKFRGNLSSRIGELVNLTKLVLSHNTFTGPLPIELQNLTHLEHIVINYNHFDGIFPIIRAPPLLNICLVQPNSFAGCPPEESVNDAKTMAYQCNLDCSGIVT
ncbi:hypothetical protein BGW42_004853 [Actinomortierella wolfii]|nr:hypothetical protein BGW42_004853 [Actinomortierella wolfii]